MRGSSKPCSDIAMEIWVTSLLLGLVLFLAMQLPQTMAGCPIDLSGSNFTQVASMCNINGDRGKCCRYINAFIAFSIARFANKTGNLGVSSDLSNSCFQSILHAMELYGVPKNATIFCGFGTKISVNYECLGRTTVTEMLESADFLDVVQNCQMPLFEDSKCRKCINAGIVYLRHVVGINDNITLNTCHDATFAALASQADPNSAADIGDCFFGVQGINMHREPFPNLLAPGISPSPTDHTSPSQQLVGIPISKKHHSYRMTLVPVLGIAILVFSVLLLLVLIVLIHWKNRQLDDSENLDFTSSKTFTVVPRTIKKVQDGYIDPEYVVTQELTEKSDLYSYGVLLLEIVTGRLAIQDGKNLVEWSQFFLQSESTIQDLVDPRTASCSLFRSYNGVPREKEGAGHLIKQVLRLLYVSSDPMHIEFMEAMGDDEGTEGRGRTSKDKTLENDGIFLSGDGRFFGSSSSASRSHCSISFLLESSSPQSHC